MSSVSQSLAGYKFVEYRTQGKFLRLMGASGPVEITYYRNGAEITKTGLVLAGYAEKFDEPFDMFRIYNSTATSNWIDVLYRMESSVNYDRAAGSVDVTSLVPTRAATATQTNTAVTTASATLVASKAARTFLLIQNKSDIGTVWVNLAGAAATQANGIEIAPGGSFELNCNVITGAVTAIGDIASNAEVIVVEG